MTSDCTIATSEPEALRGDTERAVEHLRARAAADWRVAVVTEGPGLAKRIEEVLREHEVPVAPLTGSLTPGTIAVTTGSLGRGFVHEPERFELLTETDLTGQPGTGQIGAEQYGPRQVGLAQVRLAQVRVAQIDVGQGHARPVRPFEIRSHQRGDAPRNGPPASPRGLQDAGDHGAAGHSF